MLLSNPKLAGLLDAGATIVMPSRLLATVASEQLVTLKAAEGIQSWQRREILPLSAWLTRCWQDARFQQPHVPVLLSPSQELTLWQRAFENAHPRLFDSEQAARLAMEASRLGAEWQIPLDHELWEQHEDAREFREVLLGVHSEMHRRNWISRSDLLGLLPKWIAEGTYEPQQTLFLAFDHLANPALEALWRSFGTLAQMHSIGERSPGKQVRVQECRDFSNELEIAARWARGQLEAHPQRSIGVFIPDLRSRTAAVERAFRQVFYPSDSLSFSSKVTGVDQELSAFRILSTRSLFDEPLIRNAVLLLELLRPKIAISDASAILRCPFLYGAVPERSARALADLNLRRHRDIDVTFGQIEHRTAACPILKPVWNAVGDVLRSVRPSLGMTEWSDRFGDLLNALGWPGDSLLSASEQKAVEGWKLALSDLAALDFVSGPVPFEIALGKLRRILLSNSGAETGNWSSPVQILDADDAFGLAFDSAFIAGLSEETWLLPQPLNPFLPAQLQRLFHVSGSAPDDLENERYRKAESLFAVAPLIVGSYSGRLTALAKSFSAKSSRALALWAGRSPLESFPPVSLGPALTDDQAPPFESMEAASGGVSIMKSQSLCPFRAFAEYRLQAQRPEDACFGLDARDRGGYLHKALENVWKVLQTSARLRSTDPQRLQAIVQQAVQQAVHDGEGGPFHQVINRTERERLEALILQWFSEFESTRRTPFSVEQVEEKRSVEIAGLHLRLRVDRIDRLEDGTVLLLDYKSGKLSEKDLLGERPSEPQLLVYAAAVDEPVDGIFIAQVRARELKVIGAAAHDHFPGPKRSKLNWEEMRDSSRHNLKAIAAEFMAGDAVVDPKPGACTYCNLKPLCRIEERGQAREDEDSAD